MSTVCEDVLSQVKQGQDELGHQHEVDFRALVNAVADGGDTPSPREVARILHDAGKTADDLRAAVALRQQRRQWIADIARAAEIVEQCRPLQERITQQRATLAEAQGKCDEAVKALADEIHRLTAGRPDAPRARRQLLDTMPTAINQAVARLDEQEQKLNIARKRIQDEAQQLRNDSRDAQEHGEYHRSGDSDPKQYFAEAAKLRAEAEEKDRQAQADEPQRAAIAAERAELMRRAVTEL
jgi:chromosome segregation ATPase